MQEIKLNGWVAEDKDGARFLYTTKPEIRGGWWKTDDDDIYYTLPMQLDLGPDWKKSLRQVVDNVVQEPRPELKIDDPVLVRDSKGHGWVPRHFAGWDGEGCVQTFSNGRTSFSGEGVEVPVSWQYYKLPLEYWGKRADREAASNE